MRHVRGPRSAWRLLQRIALAARRREGRRAVARARRAERKPVAGQPWHDTLGVRILTVGERARKVFEDIPGAGCRPHNRADVALVDEHDEAPSGGLPAVVLAQAPGMLSVPALNPRRHSPAGWVRDAENGAASLGHDDLLGAEVGVRYQGVSLADLGVLRRCHHVEDVAAYHEGPVARAGVLVRLAAMGVPVFLADGGAELAPLLGAELHGLMTADLRNADIAERERLSIRMRRAALRAHSNRARARQICEVAGLSHLPQPPRVAVLLVAYNLQCLASALSNVSGQRYPNLAVVLAVPGSGVEPDPSALKALPCPVEVARIDGARCAGDAVRAAVEAAGGALIATMNGRDLYGAYHLWDLVLACEHSGAALVAKAAETIHLRGPDVTLRCGLGGGERYGSRRVAGDAMLVERGAIDGAGAWQRAARGEYRALVEEVARAGAGVYRTHGAGYLAVRGGNADDEGAAIRDSADAVHAGFRPDLADMGDAPAASARVAGARRSSMDDVAAVAWNVDVRRRRMASSAPAPYCRYARKVADLLHRNRNGPRGRARRLAAAMVESAPTPVHAEVAEALDRALAQGDVRTAQRIAGAAAQSGEPRAEKILSRRHRFLWMGNPKVASRSLIRALGAVDPHAELIEHATLEEVFAHRPEARAYFTFAFVRHPYPRTHSFHTDCGPDGEKRRRLLRNHYGICGDGSFTELCEWLNTPWGSDAFADRHWLSQHVHLRLPDGRWPDFVGRLETLAQDLETVAERVGMPVPPLPLLNRMTGTLVSDRVLEARRRLRVLHLNEANKALIRRRYACDFETWGFAP